MLHLSGASQQPSQQALEIGKHMTTTTRKIDPRQLFEQIGSMTVLSISGGRWGHNPDTGGAILPCGSGYRVEIDLAANDTYTVRRVFVRSGKRFVHGEARDVYAEQVGEVAYRAGMFRDDWNPNG